MIPAASTVPIAPAVATPVMAMPVGSVGQAGEPPIVQGRPLARGQLVTTQPQNATFDIRSTPPGAPSGGEYIRMRYFGDVTCIMVVVLGICFWPAMCIPCICPCDERIVYRAPNGTLYTPQGQFVG